MKKFFKILLMLVGIVILIAVAAFTFIEVRGIPSYEVKKIDYKAPAATPEQLERGKKLVLLLCANCHKSAETGKLTGEQMLDAPHEFGKIFSQNITQDKTYGIGTWTDAELVYLLRTGIKRDGKYAPPWMAKLHHMADEDVDAIIAFLHSDDPLVTAAAIPDQPCEPAFLSKFLCLVAFKPLPMPDHKIEMPNTTNPVELGKYLVFNLDCFGCHSADFKTMDVLNPENSKGYMGGGNKTLNKEGMEVVTQNLTPDETTGIGSWTEEKFVNAVKYGTIPGQPSLRYPMEPFVYLTDNEAKAIYAYLRTIPAITNNIPRSPF
ncbi:MAG: cytochrome c [Bacteroidia bacterium]